MRKCKQYRNQKEYKNRSKEEIVMINQTKLYLSNDNRNKMLMTHYSFFSIILKEKLFSPSRWFLEDGTTNPIKGNKYFNNYKNLLINILKKNDIAVIYTIYPVESSSLYTYLDKDCFKEKKISNMLISYELKNCYKINS